MDSRESENSVYQSTGATGGTNSYEIGDVRRAAVTGRHAASDDDTSNVNVNNDVNAKLAASDRASGMPLCYDSAYLLSNRGLLENRRWQREYLANSANANLGPSVGASTSGPSTRQRRMASLRNRALKNRRQQPMALPVPSSTTIDNWAQCENCKKWRRLPPFVETDALPDTWVCALNIWDQKHMSCGDPEETVNEIRIPAGTGQIEIEHDIDPGDNLSNLGAASSLFHGNAGISLAQQLSIVLPSSKDHASIYLKDGHKQENGQFYQIPGTTNANYIDTDVSKGTLGHLRNTHDFGHGFGPGFVPGVLPSYRREVVEAEEDYAGDVFKLILKESSASGGAAGDDDAGEAADSTKAPVRSSRDQKASAASENKSASPAACNTSRAQGGALKNAQFDAANTELKASSSSTRVPTSNRLVVYSREANSLVASQLPHSVVLFEAAKRPMRKSKRLKEHVWTDDAHAHVQDEVGPTLAPLDSHGKTVNRISGVTRAVENLKDEGYNYDAHGYPVGDADADYNRDKKTANDEEDDDHEKTTDQKPAAEEEDDLEQKQDELDLGVGFGSDAKWPKFILNTSTRDSTTSHEQSVQSQSTIKTTRPALLSLFPLLSLQIPTLPTIIPTTLQQRRGSIDDAQQTTIDTQRTLGGDFFNSSIDDASPNLDDTLDDDRIQVLSNEQVLGALEALGKSAKSSVAADGDAAPSPVQAHLGRHCTSVNMVLEPDSCEPPLTIPLQMQGQQITAPGTGALPLYGSVGLITGGSAADAPVDLDPLLQPLEKLAQPLHYYSRRTTRTDRFPTSSCGTIADLLREHDELERHYIDEENGDDFYGDDGGVGAVNVDGDVVDLDVSGVNGNLLDDAIPAKDFENSQEKLEAYPALDVTSTSSRLFAPQATRYPQQLPLDPQRRALQKLREHYAISSLGKSYFKRLRGMRPDVDYPAPDFKTLRKFAQGRGHGATAGHVSNSSDLEPDDVSNTRESWTRYYHRKGGTSADVHAQDSRGSNEQFSSVSEMGEDLLGSNYRRLSNCELDDDTQAVGKLILGLDRESMRKLYQPIDYRDFNGSIVNTSSSGNVNTSNSASASITEDYFAHAIPAYPSISGATAQLVQSLSKPIPSNLYRFDTRLLERLSCEIEYPTSIDVPCGNNTLLDQL